MVRLILATALLAIGTAAYAANVDDLDVGDGMYLKGALSDELVYVVRIDKSRNRVKVRRSEDGTTKWVSPSKLFDREGSMMNTVERVAVGAVVVGCLLNPEKCKSGGSSSSSSSSSGSSSNKWQPGLSHSRYKNVVADTKKNTWRPAYGYTWVNQGKSWDVVWKPGLKHPRHANVVSADNRGKWVPVTGYEWVDIKTSWRVRWTPDMKHPRAANVVACSNEGKWCPSRGYTWVDPTKNADVKWTEWARYGSGRPNVVAAAQEGYWKPAPGYTWLDQKALTVKWVSSRQHPTNKKLISDSPEGWWLYRGGLGVSLEIADDLPKITQVHADSPADKMGIKEGMLITQVDSKSTRSLELSDVIAMLSGDVNTQVRITCLDPASRTERRYRLKRGVYRLTF